MPQTPEISMMSARVDRDARGLTRGAKRQKGGGVAAPGGRDTVFLLREGFDPMGIAVRPLKEACETPEVSFWDAMSGRVAASPENIKLSDEKEFVAGGQHRAARNPLRNWVIGATGRAECAGESPLGAEFDRYFAGYSEGEKVQLIEDKEGIKVERWIEPGYVQARTAGRETLTPNSSKVYDHQDAAAEQVYEGLRSGQYSCLGTLCDWEAAHGVYPWNNGVSIEPKKPRLVMAPFDLNEHTEKEDVVLEGLAEVRENVRWDGNGEAPYQVAHDQKSGYNNMGMSETGKKLFIFVVFGFVFCENTVSYGWINAAYLQQRGSMVGFGFLRHLGVL